MKNKIEIPLEKTNLLLPVIKFFLPNSDEPYYGIIDSGSEITLMDDKFILNNKNLFKIHIDDTVQTTVGISNDNGTELNINVQGDIIVNSKSITLDSYVAPLAHLSEQCKSIGDNIIISALIGIDTLLKYNCVLSVKDKKLILYDICSK